MRVKIGNTWHDSRDEPICIKINAGEQQQIADMDRSVATKGMYAKFPDHLGLTKDEKILWMKEGDE